MWKYPMMTRIRGLEAVNRGGLGGISESCKFDPALEPSIYCNRLDRFLLYKLYFVAIGVFNKGNNRCAMFHRACLTCYFST